MKTASAVVRSARTLTMSVNGSSIPGSIQVFKHVGPFEEKSYTIAAGGARLLSSQRTAKAAALGIKDDHWPSVDIVRAVNNKY